MRFMMIWIPKGGDSAAPRARSSLEAIMNMREYHQSARKAGVLLAVDGLLPPSMGARISRADGKTTVREGPFAEANEIIGGYWILQVHSREEAIEWARRAPIADHEIIEVRQLFESADFAEPQPH